jgi:hypothetical protein
MYDGVSKSFRTGRLERELQMVQLSATMCGCIGILCVSLVSFAAITLCVAPQRVFIAVVYFVIDSVRKPSYMFISLPKNTAHCLNIRTDRIYLEDVVQHKYCLTAVTIQNGRHD